MKRLTDDELLWRAKKDRNYPGWRTNVNYIKILYGISGERAKRLINALKQVEVKP